MTKTHLKAHLALYGSVQIPRAYCDACQGYSLVIHGELACCRQPIDESEITKTKRMSHPPEERHLPPLKLRKFILQIQGDRCFYCNRPFGLQMWNGTKSVRLKIEWDHMVPFSYAQNNQTDNIVAACHVCNRQKGSLMFQTVEEASVYLDARWKEIGYTFRRPEILPTVFGAGEARKDVPR